MKRLAAVTAGLLFALSGAVDARAKGEGIEASLVRCTEVTYPLHLGSCGTDPLATGRLEVKQSGDLEATVTGALPSSTYEVFLGTIDGSNPTSIVVMSTDASGNGKVQAPNAFDLDQAGVVVLALIRNAQVQFVAGFVGDRQLKAGLLPCGAINVPVALSGCGSDALKHGEVKIEDGDVKVELYAGSNAAYDVVIRPFGGPDVALGTLTTNNKGKGQLRVENFVPDTTVGTGNVVLRRDAHDQFVTGFQVTSKRPPFVAKFQAGLLRCASVNTLAALAGCGADQLKKGEVFIDEKGDVKVHLFGAVPLTDYEVFFVAFDASSEVSLGTLTTNPAGNGHAFATDAFPAGTRGAGNVVVKRAGIQQYVTGFVVVR
jgi:hypothetical protein